MQWERRGYLIQQPAGDFTRRFTPEDICGLMEGINRVRSRVWTEGRKERFKEALIDDFVD